MEIGNFSRKNFIELLKETKDDVLLFGAGTYGDILGKFLNKHNIEWDGYIDNNVLFQKEKLNGKNIFPISKIKGNELIIISTIFFQPILEQIALCRREMNNVYWFESKALLNEITDEITDSQKYTSRIKKLHNIHCGQRCFLIGNGPSLTIDDLNLLENENTFAANKIFQVYEKTSWRPRYYFVDDPYIVKTCFSDKESFIKVIRDCHASFTSTRRKMYEYREEDDYKKVYYFKAINDLQDGIPSFSKDCSNQVYTSYTIIYTMLQFAMYMGFTEIFLLGVDHNYSIEKNINGQIIKDSKIKNHASFMDDNNFDIEHIPEIGIMNIGFNVAKKYAEERNIQIYNATRGGKLEVFPRVKLEEIL